MLQVSLVLFLSNGTAKTKLAILPFLYCGDFVKSPIVTAMSEKASTEKMKLKKFGLDLVVQVGHG